ncbi:MAG: nucleotide exchange factor GrpE [bacterium]|nr:nucleotide exchange factor GrpE [bacterium]
MSISSNKTNDDNDQEQNLEADQETTPEALDSFERSESITSLEETSAEEFDLEAEYQKLRLDLDEYKNLFLRKAAEFENFKKRKQTEFQMFLKAAEEALILDILPVMDDIDRLLASTEGDAEMLRRGAQLIRDKLWEKLSARGLEPIEAVGFPFDPTLHDALMQQKTEENTPGTVLAEHEKGYKLAGKIIRHAKVVVSS